MNKDIIFVRVVQATIIIGTITFVAMLLNYLITQEDKVKTYNSTTGCCKIIVDNSNADYYIVTYYNYIDKSTMVQSTTSVFEADEYVNMFQEICYHEHPQAQDEWDREIN